MATVFRPLLATRIERRKVSPAFDSPNLLVSTLFVATIASSVSLPVEKPARPQPEAQSTFRALLEASPTPFKQDDFQNPSRKRAIYTVDALGTPRILFEALAVPFAQSDYQVPEVVRRRYDHDWQGTTQIVSLSAAPKAFAQFDWPNPVRKPPHHESLSDPSMLLTVLETAEVVQRLPTYSPAHPKWIRERQQPQVWSSVALLAGPEVAPFSQVDWHVEPKPELIEAHALYTVHYEPAVPDPFALRDWPTAVRRRAIDLSYAADLSPGLLAEVVVLPFAQTQWPVVRKIVRFQETPQPNLQGLLYVIPQAPFRETNWPGAQRLVGRFDYNLPSRLETLPPPEIPFGQDEWVNPERKRDPHFDVWGQTLQHTTLFVENVKPFHQDDWNVGFLFEAKPTYTFISYQPKVIIEGGGLSGLQPPTYVVGTMTVTFGVSAPMSLLGRSLDGEMQITFAVDGSIDETEEFEGPV